MKKMLLVPLLVLASVCVLAIFFITFDQDRLVPDHPAGKQIYYTEVTNQGVQQSASGRYEYELLSYDEDGDEKVLTFTTSKQLLDGAYIMLYSTFFRGVTYWQEVSVNDLPQSVKEIYGL